MVDPPTGVEANRYLELDLSDEVIHSQSFCKYLHRCNEIGYVGLIEFVEVQLRDPHGDLRNESLVSSQLPAS